MYYVVIYLAAIVAANLSAGYFGPSSTIVNAFLFVGLVMTTRDALHDAWGKKVRPRMAVIIGVGGLLSLLLGEGRIAMASCAAFVVSEATDFLVYHKLRRHGWMIRSNGSNSAGAVVDSIVFPTLAFGVLLPWIILGQITAKIGGGWLWSFVLKRRMAGTAAVVALAIASPTNAQVVAVGAGALFTEVDTSPTLELFAATPPLSRFRLSTVIATDDHGTLTYIVKGGLEARRWITFEAGASWLRFRDYESEPFLGVFIRRTIRRKFHLGIAVSSEPWKDWNTVAVVKIDFWSWFRR